jgi:hypothetical protein
MTGSSSFALSIKGYWLLLQKSISLNTIHKRFVFPILLVTSTISTMRKLIFLLSAQMLMMHLKAQFRIGFHAASTYSAVKVAGDMNGYGSKFGVGGGLLLNCPIGEKLAFNAEINYVEKGFVYKGLIRTNNGAVNGDVTGKFNYLEIPVSIDFGFPVGVGRLSFGGGASLAFALSGKTAYRAAGYQPLDQEVKFGSAAGEMKSMDIGVNMYAMYLMDKGWYMKMGYTLGVSNLANASGSELYNRNLIFQVGYAFKLGGSGGGGSKKPSKKLPTYKAPAGGAANMSNGINHNNLTTTNNPAPESAAAPAAAPVAEIAVPPTVAKTKTFPKKGKRTASKRKKGLVAKS